MHRIPLKFRIVIYGVLFMGLAAGLSFLGTWVPAMAKGTRLSSVLLYGWAIIMLLLIYPFFIAPLLKTLRMKNLEE